MGKRDSIGLVATRVVWRLMPSYRKRCLFYGNHVARSRYLSIPAAVRASYRHGPVGRGQPGISEGTQDRASQYDLHLARTLRSHTRRRAAGYAVLTRGSRDI